MGARFDKWLARPSTIHFLRQLVGPEHALAPTRRSYLASPAAFTRRHTTNWTPSRRPENVQSEKKVFDPQAGADLETFQEQRQRVAKELKLYIPEGYQDPRISPQEQGLELSGYSNLLYAETRVRDVSSTRWLLIDLPENHNNLEAWRSILQYRERMDGFNGVLDVWKGMRNRGIDLPVTGDHAATFWTIFLHAAIVPYPDENHEALLEAIYTHAKELKDLGRGQYRLFHKILVGRFLRAPSAPRQNGPEYAWHERARKDGLCPLRSLAEVVEDVLKSKRPYLAFRRFKQMYIDDRERNLYDSCMHMVLLHAAGDGKIIVAWHNFFVSNDDKPGPELSASQSIQYLTGMTAMEDGASPPERIKESDLAQIFTTDRENAARSLFPSLSRASMSSLVGDVHGIKPKAISDKFCARMFATQTFSLETIIRGIALLGTEALGPVAIREMAIRAGTPEEFKIRLSEIKDAGMQLVPSIYTRLLERVATTSQHDLFQAMLESDQHPESYDDQHIQESLLADFLRTENWPQAYLTLLGLSQADKSMSSPAWNRLLQHHVRARDYAEIVRIFDHIRAEQLFLSRRSLNFMRKYLLATRTPAKRPIVSDKTPDGNFKSLDYVVNAHIYAAARGGDVEHYRWIEFLKRYGMFGKMKKIKNLTAWLASICPSREPEYALMNGMVKRRSHKMPTLAFIFNPVMLRAIVIWGFHDAGARDALRPSPRQLDADPGEIDATSLYEDKHVELWAQGLSILLQLKRLGVRVETSNVRRAMEEVLWIWFGPGRSERDANLQAVRRNHLSLAHYVIHANEIWDEPLFDLAPEILENEVQLIRAVFGNERRADQRTGAWVDVDLWSATKADGIWQAVDPPMTTRKKGDEHIPDEFKFYDNLPRRQRRRRKLRVDY